MNIYLRDSICYTDTMAYCHLYTCEVLFEMYLIYRFVTIKITYCLMDAKPYILMTLYIH